MGKQPLPNKSNAAFLNSWKWMGEARIFGKTCMKRSGKEIILAREMSSYTPSCALMHTIVPDLFVMLEAELAVFSLLPLQEVGLTPPKKNRVSSWKRSWL